MGDKKDNLSELLRRVEERASAVEKIGHTIVQDARLSQDCASSAREAIDSFPSDDLLPAEEWDRSIAAWEDWCKVANGVESAQIYVNSFSAVTSGAGLTTSGIFYQITRPLPPQSQAIVDSAANKFFQVIDKTASASEVEASMMRLGLNVRGGTNRTPVDLLRDAQGALERPSTGEGSPVAILIALRECTNSVLAELLRRRPRQEPTPKTEDKVCSIGRQCGHGDLSPDHFTRLAMDARALLDELSGAKQAEMARKNLLEQFNRGLLFLKAFLDSIDETKLRA